MRLLVLDPTLLLEALLVREGRARRLFVLLAYGREANFARLYDSREATERLGPSPRGGLVGGPSYEDLVAEGEDLLHELAERLPPDAPDDLGLVLSPPLLRDLDETVIKLQRAKPSKGIDPSSIRLAVLAHASVVLFQEDAIPQEWRRWDGREGPIATRGHLLDAAAQTGAYAVISDDESLSQSSTDPTMFESTATGQPVTVLTLDLLIERELRRFNLDAVDPGLLALGSGTR